MRISSFGLRAVGDFFAFLCSGEFTLKQGEHYDPNWHLSITDVAVDSVGYPTMLQIYIKGSETDQWQQGTHLIVGHTNSHICPVKSLLAYIAVRGFQENPIGMALRLSSNH